MYIYNISVYIWILPVIGAKIYTISFTGTENVIVAR